MLKRKKFLNNEQIYDKNLKVCQSLQKECQYKNYTSLIFTRFYRAVISVFIFSLFAALDVNFLIYYFWGISDIYFIHV